MASAGGLGCGGFGGGYAENSTKTRRQTARTGSAS